MRKNYAQLRFSPRPTKIKRVRKFSTIGQFTYIEDSAGRLTTRMADGEFAIEFQNSDRFAVGVNDDYELLLRAVHDRARARVFRPAATSSRPAASATTSDSSGRSPAMSSSSRASSTTAPGRR